MVRFFDAVPVEVRRQAVQEHYDCCNTCWTHIQEDLMAKYAPDLAMEKARAIVDQWAELVLEAADE